MMGRYGVQITWALQALVRPVAFIQTRAEGEEW